MTQITTDHDATTDPAVTTSTATAAPRVSAFVALRGWSARQWGFAALAAVVTALVIGVPTDVIPNPVFGRPVDVTWWSPWVLAVTAVLAGLLVGTYVRNPGDAPPGRDPELDKASNTATIGGLLGYFAVGCPVCNKLALVALGSSGALKYFAPLQPILAVASIVLLAVALRGRLRGSLACRVPSAGGREH